MNRSGTQLDYFFVLHVMSTPLQRPNPNMCLTHPNYYKRIFQVTLPGGLLQLIPTLMYSCTSIFSICGLSSVIRRHMFPHRKQAVGQTMSLSVCCSIYSLCVCVSVWGGDKHYHSVAERSVVHTHTHKETHTAHTRQQQKPWGYASETQQSGIHPYSASIFRSACICVCVCVPVLQHCFQSTAGPSLPFTTLLIWSTKAEVHCWHSSFQTVRLFDATLQLLNLFPRLSGAAQKPRKGENTTVELSNSLCLCFPVLRCVFSP